MQWNAVALPCCKTMEPNSIQKREDCLDWNVAEELFGVLDLVNRKTETGPTHTHTRATNYRLLRSIIQQAHTRHKSNLCSSRRSFARHEPEAARADRHGRGIDSLIGCERVVVFVASRVRRGRTRQTPGETPAPTNGGCCCCGAPAVVSEPRETATSKRSKPIGGVGYSIWLVINSSSSSSRVLAF